MPWYEILKANFDNWAATPLSSSLAVALGCFVGFLLSRMRHQGQIDTLKERIIHRDEQITVKDNAIQALSEKAPAQALQARTRDAATPSNSHERSSEPSELMLSIRRQAIDSDREKTLLQTRYRFVFNPAVDRSKVLTFLPNGLIGEGRNNNEATWRLSNDKLEIFDGAGALYSRFGFLNDGRSLHHTNEPDTRSIRGQYMVPIDTPPLHLTVQG